MEGITHQLNLMDELKKVVRGIVDEALTEKENEKSEKAAKMSNSIGRLVIAGDVMKSLKVSSATLWRWAKCGYLVPIKVGTKNYYKAEDLERITKY